MTRELEDDLHQLLSRAAERAPRAPSGFPARIVTRSRRRRARGRGLLAAAAVVLVVGGTGVTVRAGEGPDTAAHPPATPATPATTATASVERPDLVERVWPEAVWKVPVKLPGGRKGRPKIFLDDRTLLLETWESHEKADALYAYDLETGKVRRITAIRTPKGVFASGFAVGAGRIFWQTIEEGRTRFWSVPVEGGEPAAVATDRAVRGRGDALAVAGDRIAFSLLEGGVFTLPLGGGSVTPVAGADRHHILRWPWVGTPGDYTPDGETSFEELLNAETGETSRAVVRPGERDVRCGVTTCVGRGPEGRPFYRLRDGSGERDLPDSPLGLAADRFMTAPLPPPSGGQTLLDLATGRSADLGLRRDGEGRSISVQPGLGDGRLVAYERGDQYVVIDLSRIR
ncbi:hypothetical protein ACGF0J_32160 [Nonomuraea sp. NPDC047897]|uniref:hypothetical protein n=1 Tax=Nonomuraea sp. NPDC047897 TaxID=3364346 RepID=UPI00371EAA22